MYKGYELIKEDQDMEFGGITQWSKQVFKEKIMTAFLNGHLNEAIYIKQPPGYIDEVSTLVCKLNKSLYGLKQAATTWNETIN